MRLGRVAEVGVLIGCRRAEGLVGVVVVGRRLAFAFVGHLVGLPCRYGPASIDSERAMICVYPTEISYAS